MRRKRAWLYLPALVAVIGLIGFWNWERIDLQNQNQATITKNLAAAQASLKTYLANQTDGSKLVGLAKRLSKNQPELVKPVVEKAYQLAPNNPDVVYLASAYQPELKAKALQLNPLLDQTINPNAPLGQLR